VSGPTLRPILNQEQRANMQRLVDALRSGQYRQGQERLRTETPDGPLLCCLGVATEEAIKAGFPAVWHPQLLRYLQYDPYSRESDNPGHIFDMAAADGSDIHVNDVDGHPIIASEVGLLLNGLLSFYGFLGVYGTVEIRCDAEPGPCTHGPEDECAIPVWAEATRLNDDLRWNFGQIADAFEHTYLSSSDQSDASKD